jgi:hypothetical protein
MFAQTPVAEKKGEPAKSKDDKDPAKSPPLDKTPTPADAIIDILNERIKALERQVANDKALPSSCKLVGKLDGDFLLFTAEIGFATLQPKTTVLLGLKGAFLTDEGDLDGMAPNLGFSDDGYLVRVAKEGPHRLVLNMRVAAPIKKSAGNALERAAKLDMPGAAATTLLLDLPRSVEELTWNDNAEKTKAPGHWELGLGAIKSLSLNWKEPTPNVGNTPLAKVDGQIVVRVEDSAINVVADLFLEDLRPFSKEWLLWLPAQAKVIDVKGPNGASREWKVPGAGLPYYRIPDVSPGKWQVSITQRLMRPNTSAAHVPIGPFHVLGAFQHHGTITVQMPAEVSFGQRLIFARFGKTEQFKNTDTDAAFHYTMPLVTEKMPKTATLNKAPLELEWRNEKNQLETQVEHALKLKTTSQGWEIETVTRIKATALFAPFNSIDLKLPLPRPRGTSVIGTAGPALGFPGSLPWGGMWKTFGLPLAPPQVEDASILDENGNPLRLMPQDATGKVRVISERAPAKQLTVLVKHAFLIPAQLQRVRLELPRPLNTNDQRVKLTIETDERVELLHGPAGAEEPVPNRHHFDMSWEHSPSQVELAWRPYQREIVAQATLDITLFERSALVTQAMRIPRESLTSRGVDPKQQLIRLLIPHGVGKVNVLSGGEITSHDTASRTLKNGGIETVAWLHAPAEGQEPVDVVLQYDLALRSDPKEDQGALDVTPIWPAHVSQKDVKVRVWASPSAVPRLPTAGLNREWKERSIEGVEKKDQFPAIVLQGFGADLPLTLRIEKSNATPLAAFVADRALIEVRMKEDDSQHCRARYWLRKIRGPYVDVELPLALSRFREPPTFVLGNKVIVAEKKDATERVVRLKIHPDLMATPAILEMDYTIPADAMERNTAWRTTLLAPVFHSEVVIAQMRWLFNAPGPLLAFSWNRKARPDWQWGLQGWLPAPETAVSSADLDGWLLGKESAQAAEPVTYSFALITLQPETVYHLPRHWWLLGCSGVFLLVTLGGYFSPLPRLAYWLLLFVLGLSSLVLAIACPALLPPLAFGLQPGLVLFLAFAGAHWLIQERYRRQLVFMPGFVRPKTGSTMMRSNSANQRPREASTVDAQTAAAEAKAEEAPETPSAAS